MTNGEWLETYGEPKDWELATAILEQIESYRNATRILVSGPNGRRPTSLTRAMGMTDEQFAGAAIEQAKARVSRPVVDLEEARRKIGPIGESGGWGNFIQGLE